jgi:ATP-binding cassette subfamily C (CFTR/MRP) protein 4
MVCVERVAEYSKVESEAALEQEVDDDLPPNWPQSGHIVVKDLAIRYRSNLPLSLRGISFEIKSGQRIGVVGRTGSGKSTLVQSLFRLLEAEKGCIYIDGVDIASIGLHKLRMSMSVINQYPTLFSGCTVRENLDPFHHYSDDDIKHVLEDVQMYDTVINNLPGGLDSYVAENGCNFSVGERQLLCLARATLQKSRILVLDEPTANVDTHTDKLLQDAVSKSFGPQEGEGGVGATIISIAHRLDTIIGNDMILVLGNGKVLEYGSPMDLLENEHGYFSGMVDDTGVEMAQQLRKKARRSNMEEEDEDDNE